VPLSPIDAPSYQAMLNIGKVFQEYDSDSTAMVVLEGEDQLGDSAHEFYDELVARLEADDDHVRDVQDFWSDPLTAAGSQSVDGKSAYVQVFLNGSQGTSASYDSVAAVRQIVNSVPAPPGTKAHVAGNTVLNADTSVAGHQSMTLMELVSVGVIVVMLLVIYRSIVTTLVSMVIIGLELSAAQGFTAAAGHFNLIGLTPYAVSMVTVNYLDENGQPNLVETAPLPWSHTIVTTLPSMSANILVQGERDVRDLACRVTVDGDVRDDRSSSDSIKPFIYCLVKSV
jgi:RND superfamily putative drug exporter